MPPPDLTADAPPSAAIPGDGGWPIIGYTLRYLRGPHALMAQRYARYGEVSWIRMFGMRIVSLLGPDANALVLRNADDAFASSAWEYFLARFFHRGLMLLDFDEHRMHRRIMQPAFRADALAGYLAEMQPVIDASLADWPTGDDVRAFDAFKRLTLDIGTHVFVGEPPGPEADALNAAFFDAVQAPTGLIRANLPGTRWGRGVRARRVLERFFSARIAAKRAGDGGDLFAELCRARTPDGDRFSDADVINHMIFLLMAAHDTSTITLSNIVYQVARDRAWQTRLREQSRRVGDVTLDPDALARLTDLDLVIKEALRLTPPVPFLPRRTTRDVAFKGHVIAASSFVQIAPTLTHRLPQCWDDPQAFDPDRFAEPRREDRRHAHQWVPFGGGAHKCIGLHFGEMEIKAIAHKLLLRFEWSVPDGYVMPQNTKSLPVPADGLPIRLQRLKSARQDMPN